MPHGCWQGMMDDVIRLGLIGDNIAASQSPRLHELAGLQNGRRVHYDRLVPRELGMDFDAVFDHACQFGYRGVNVTYPYKERAVGRVAIDDPLVAAIGAVNTVLFDADVARGFNTDHTGFLAACRKARGDRPLGRVLLIGAGGVGRAIAFGLVRLGCRDLAIADSDTAKADALAAVLQQAEPTLALETGASAIALSKGVTGIANATPVGMVGYDGTPLARQYLGGAEWVFDAVYTPVETRFLKDAAAEGLTVISGYELFIGQGVDAWGLFTGLPLDEVALRQALQSV